MVLAEVPGVNFNGVGTGGKERVFSGNSSLA